MTDKAAAPKDKTPETNAIKGSHGKDGIKTKGVLKRRRKIRKKSRATIFPSLRKQSQRQLLKI